MIVKRFLLVLPVIRYGKNMGLTLRSKRNMKPRKILERSKPNINLLRRYK